ncbi:hypothetical protein KY363_00725 [Candidatus Woesearchaeota archaeon]|nr:hypothetical protein [Candidatus Woesearchaeota archaeon]
MVSRKIRSRSKPISIKLKKSSRNARRRGYYSSYSSSSFLDQTFSIRSVLKYSGIVLGFAIVLFCVFMLGRVSANDPKAVAEIETSQLSGQTKQVVKDDVSAVTEPQAPSETTKSANSTGSLANLSGDKEDTFKTEYKDGVLVVDVGEPAADEADDDGDADQASSCTPKAAGFDYNYTNVLIEVSNFQRELKGDNWGSIDSLKLTITNNEACTIINPTKIKIKMNPKGKGSVWWDDDVFLSDSFKRMQPGKTVTEIVPVHVSYSDIYSEKDFRLTVFDDYDIAMGTFKKYITLP